MYITRKKLDAQVTSALLSANFVTRGSTDSLPTLPVFKRVRHKLILYTAVMINIKGIEMVPSAFSDIDQSNHQNIRWVCVPVYTMTLNQTYDLFKILYILLRSCTYLGILYNVICILVCMIPFLIPSCTIFSRCRALDPQLEKTTVDTTATPEARQKRWRSIDLAQCMYTCSRHSAYENIAQLFIPTCACVV